MIKLNDVILEVRDLINDTGSGATRYSDEVLLRFANTVLKRTALLRPDLFAIIADIPCTNGEVLQSMPADSIRLIDIYSVRGGTNAVIEVDKRDMDRASPNWINAPAGAAVNFMRHVRNSNKFFIYPKAPAGQNLVAEYAQTPKVYTSSEDVQLLPEAFFTAIVDGTVWYTQTVDNEHIDSGRAEMFYSAYTNSLGASIQSWEVTDKDNQPTTSNNNNNNGGNNGGG